MKHELKLFPQFYQAVASGQKNFEVRPNDRGFQKGDSVILKEWNPEDDGKGQPIGYTYTRDLEFKIGYVLSLENGWVAFSLLDKSYEAFK